MQYALDISHGQLRNCARSYSCLYRGHTFYVAKPNAMQAGWYITKNVFPIFKERWQRKFDAINHCIECIDQTIILET
jgi:hypothetical protein